MRNLILFIALFPLFVFGQTTPTLRQVTSAGTAITKLPSTAATTIAATDTIIVFNSSVWKKAPASAFGGTGWLLLGNAGTVAGTNFLGTTDNQAVVIKSNSNEVARFYPGYQLAIGGTSEEIYIGKGSGLNQTISGNNTALGFSTLFAVTSGGDNTAIGHGSMADNTDGIDNTAVGSSSLAFNIGGQNNTAVGMRAVWKNTTGILNSGFGDNALSTGTTGNFNSAFGATSLASNLTGYGNTAVGYRAGFSALGSSNVFLGDSSGYAWTGSDRLFIGNTISPYAFTGDFTTGYFGIGTGQTAPGALLDLGLAGTTKGVVRFAGNTSGNVTLQPLAAAGTYTLTLPADDGAASQYLQTDGAGVTSWQTVSSGLTVGTTPIASGTVGALLFEGATNVLQEDATQLFWDNTNDFLGLGINASLAARLHVKGSGADISTYSMKVDNSASNPSLYVSDGRNVGIGSIAYSTVGLMVSGVGSSDYALYCDDNGVFTNPGLFAVRNNGTVGIGVNAPLYKFHVKNSTNHMFVIEAAGLDGAGHFGMGTLPEADSRLHIMGENSETTKTALLIQNSINTYPFYVDNARNIGFNNITNFDVTSRGILSIGNTTTVQPTVRADQIDIWCQDISAGNSAFYTRSEGGEIFSFGSEFGAQSNHAISFVTNSTEQLNLTTDGRLYGKSLHNNAGAVTGATNQYIASGTYTATITDSANTSATTAFQSQWTRVGNVVTVSGVVDVDPTLTGATIIKMTLPIASNFTIKGNCRGTATAESIEGQSAAIIETTAYASSDFALMKWIAVDVTNQAMSFEFTYVVQ